jgi:hypothetical protein
LVLSKCRKQMYAKGNINVNKVLRL